MVRMGIGTLTNKMHVLGLKKTIGLETRPLLVSIEGNIGAGKSTLIKALRQKIDEKNKIVSSAPTAPY